MTPGLGRPAWLAAALALLARAPAQHVRLEVVAPTRTVYLGESVPVVVRIGYDQAFFTAQGIPLLQQRLDVLFQVVLPWFQDPSLAAAPAVVEGGLRVPTGDRVLTWRHLRDEPDGWRWLELPVHLQPPAAGLLELPPVEVRYAYTTRYEEHFLRGRQPIDRLAGGERAAARLLVAELPTAGQPAGFAGLLGDLTTHATVAPATAAVGEVVTLAVTLAGTGNWRSAPPLPAPELPGFLVQGMVESRTATDRTCRFDLLVLREGLQEVPAFPVVVFDPVTASYATRPVGPLPLQTTPATATLEPRLAALVAADLAARRRAAAWPWWVWAGLVVTGGGLGFLLRGGLQRTKRRAHGERLGAAVLAALPGGVAPTAAAWQALLAAAGGPSRDGDAFAVWLQGRGADPAAIAQVRNVAQAIDAARYGGLLPSAAEVAAAVGTIRRFIV